MYVTFVQNGLGAVVFLEHICNVTTLRNVIPVTYVECFSSGEIAYIGTKSRHILRRPLRTSVTYAGASLVTSHRTECTNYDMADISLTRARFVAGRSWKHVLLLPTRGYILERSHLPVNSVETISE